MTGGCSILTCCFENSRLSVTIQIVKHLKGGILLNVFTTESPGPNRAPKHSECSQCCVNLIKERERGKEGGLWEGRKM
jgi:hypothetical protein